MIVAASPVIAIAVLCVPVVVLASFKSSWASAFSRVLRHAEGRSGVGAIRRPRQGSVIRPGGPLTDPVVAQEYLDECRARGLSEATIRRYNYVIKALDQIGAGSYSPGDMTKERLSEWAVWMRETRKRAGSDIGLAARFLKWVAWKDTHPEWIEIPHMIPAHLRILHTRSLHRVTRPEMPVLTFSQMQSLIESSQALECARQREDQDLVCGPGSGEPGPCRNSALLALLWDTGFRIGEALSMDTRHVFQAADVKGVLRWFAYCPRSKTRPRKVILSDSLPIMLPYVRDRGPDEPLWTSTGGKRLNYHSWKGCLNRIIEIARRTDPVISFPRGSKSHLIRHSRATYLANQGWNEAMLMNRFGWDRPDMAAHYVEQARLDTGTALDRVYNPLSLHHSPRTGTPEVMSGT